jgi:hypothetical protein
VSKKATDGHHLHVIIPHDLWERLQQHIAERKHEKLNAKLALVRGLRLYLEKED